MIDSLGLAVFVPWKCQVGSIHKDTNHQPTWEKCCLSSRSQAMTSQCWPTHRVLTSQLFWILWVTSFLQILPFLLFLPVSGENILVFFPTTLYLLLTYSVLLSANYSNRVLTLGPLPHDSIAVESIPFPPLLVFGTIPFIFSWTLLMLHTGPHHATPSLYLLTIRIWPWFFITGLEAYNPSC